MIAVHQQGLRRFHRSKRSRLSPRDRARVAVTLVAALFVFACADEGLRPASKVAVEVSLREVDFGEIAVGASARIRVEAAGSGRGRSTWSLDDAPAGFDVTPTSFSLRDTQSTELDVRFAPTKAGE